jgi:hypothetical protein
MSAMFDAQQQALRLQRKLWGEMLNQSREAVNRMDADRRVSADRYRSRS